MTSIELSVVIPTINERGNIQPLLERLNACLTGIAWEAIFVDDDSTDGTTELIREIASRNDHVRLIHRIGRRGLASACTEGMAASHASFLAKMDADLQHNEQLLLQMLKILRNQSVDIVVGSRFVPGGNLGNFSLCRRSISATARRLSRLVLKADLNDPMSGFFMLRRDFFQDAMRHLTNTGFEILLDLLVSSPGPARIVELPYRFGHRVYGQSKLDEAVILEYLKLIADKLFGHVVPVSFVSFLLVWTLGLVAHLAVLKILYQLVGMNFVWAQAAATFILITGSFFCNNRITYCDRRLRGRDLIRGLFKFCSVCAIGAVANIGVAKMLYEHDVGWLMSGLLGAMLGLVWNYGVATTLFNWYRRK